MISRVKTLSAFQVYIGQVDMFFMIAHSKVFVDHGDLIAGKILEAVQIRRS